jgi:acyl-CoA reductase-like NAD-dependent aldehyde dehydrogenase
MLDFSMTIGGRQVAGASTFDVRNPATGELVDQASSATIEDLDRAVAIAKAAFSAWAAMPDEARQAACAALTGKIAEHAEEMALLLTLEQGKPLGGLGSHFEL